MMEAAAAAAADLHDALEAALDGRDIQQLEQLAVKLQLKALRATTAGGP